MINVKKNIEEKKETVIDKIRNSDPETILYWSLVIGYYAVHAAFIVGTIATAKRATGLMYLAREDGIMSFDTDRFNGWALRQSPKRLKEFWKNQKSGLRLFK